MLGSVLSNLLLVMGCCFLFGGIKNKEQRFNAVAAVANLSLLFLATIALVVPTPIG
jgi:Ca2+:H+ antiporter